jgi:hypothetical protein
MCVPLSSRKRTATCPRCWLGWVCPRLQRDPPGLTAFSCRSCARSSSRRAARPPCSCTGCVLRHARESQRLTGAMLPCACPQALSEIRSAVAEGASAQSVHDATAAVLAAFSKVRALSMRCVFSALRLVRRVAQLSAEVKSANHDDVLEVRTELLAMAARPATRPRQAINNVRQLLGAPAAEVCLAPYSELLSNGLFAVPQAATEADGDGAAPGASGVLPVCRGGERVPAGTGSLVPRSSWLRYTAWSARRRRPAVSRVPRPRPPRRCTRPLQSASLSLDTDPHAMC